MKVFSKLVAMLSSEFYKYLMANPEVSQGLPRNALVIFRIEGEEEFNRWSEEMALRNKERGQLLVYITIGGWRESPAWEKVDVGKAIEFA